MFFIEFYADWVLPSTLVTIWLKIRVNNYGIAIQTNIRQKDWNFCK